jgi:hypothetical protein
MSQRTQRLELPATTAGKLHLICRPKVSGLTGVAVWPFLDRIGQQPFYYHHFDIQSHFQPHRQPVLSFITVPFYISHSIALPNDAAQPPGQGPMRKEKKEESARASTQGALSGPIGSPGTNPSHIF